MNVEGLGDRLEGASRPGHFRGVATVVLKLLRDRSPRFAYFGRKDAQQARIIQARWRATWRWTREIVVCPIVREPDGLAMSSRNAYLTRSERHAATVLFIALWRRAAKRLHAGERDAARLADAMRHVLAARTAGAVDYVEIVDAESFEPVMHVCAAHAWLCWPCASGDTRLIDNALITAADGEFQVTI